jgi:hypothetical protein
MNINQSDLLKHSMCNMENRKIIKVEVPKEIWDADMSFWNVLFGRRDIVGAWMKSVVDVINQIKSYE